MVDFQTPQGGTIGIADAPIAALRDALRGSLLLPERCRLRRRARDLERDDRPPAGADRALRRRRRRDAAR